MSAVFFKPRLKVQIKMRQWPHNVEITEAKYTAFSKMGFLTVKLFSAINN